MWVLTHDKKNKTNQQLRVFGVPWSPDGFVLGLPPRRWGSKNGPSDHETQSNRRHVGVHVDFTSILHSIHILPRLVPEA
jgi:hypothetical protein